MNDDYHDFDLLILKWRRRAETSDKWDIRGATTAYRQCADELNHLLANLTIDAGVKKLEEDESRLA